MTSDRPGAAEALGHPDPPRGLPVRGTVIVAAGMLVSQLVAMSQMLVVSRVLGPVQFGVFGALAVIVLLGSTAMAATQVVIARHVASGREQRHVGTGPVLVVGGLACATTVAVAPLVSSALHLSGVFGMVLVGATFVPFVITGAQLGLLQGAERHLRLGSLYVVSTAARVGGAITGALVGGTAEATVTGLALGATAGAAAGQLLLGGLPTWGSREEGARDFLGEVFHAAHALIALSALTNVDQLIARAQLSGHEAGMYAAGALIARAVFFLPQAILIAAFPRMVAGVRHAQRQAVAAVACLGILATLTVAVLPHLVIMIMSGSQYLEIVPDAWLFALEGAGFAVVQVLLYARMAHHDRRAAILLWGGAAVLLALGLTLGTSVHALVCVGAAVAWSVALMGVALSRIRPARPRPPVDVAARTSAA